MIIIGSQSILGQFPDVPELAARSMEADIIVVNHPELWNLIDGTLGEGSPFHEQFGYYADGVEESTAILPNGWKNRLIPLCNENTRQIKGLCLEVHDLLISKYISGREKDLEFCRSIVKANLVSKPVLLDRLMDTDIDDDTKSLVQHRIARDFS